MRYAIDDSPVAQHQPVVNFWKLLWQRKSQRLLLFIELLFQTLLPRGVPVMCVPVNVQFVDLEDNFASCIARSNRDVFGAAKRKGA